MSEAHTRHFPLTPDAPMDLTSPLRRAELIDGHVVLSPNPTAEHQRLTLGVAAALVAWAAGRAPAPTVLTAPLDVRFGPQTVLQPDVSVWLTPLDVPASRPVDAVPNVVVEVADGDRVLDRITKRYLYASAGVEEYWLIHSTGSIERLSGPQLAQHRTLDSDGDALTTPRLPGFSLAVAPLRALVARTM